MHWSGGIRALTRPFGDMIRVSACCVAPESGSPPLPDDLGEPPLSLNSVLSRSSQPELAALTKYLPDSITQGRDISESLGRISVLILFSDEPGKNASCPDQAGVAWLGARTLRLALADIPALPRGCQLSVCSHDCRQGPWNVCSAHYSPHQGASWTPQGRGG